MTQPDETGAIWRKSTRSGATGSCVEVAFRSDAVLVRNSNDPQRHTLRVTRAAWIDFLARVKNNEFDL